MAILLEKSHLKVASNDLDLHPLVNLGRRNATLTLVANRLYAQPFLTGRGGSVDRVLGNVFTSTGCGTLRVALYARTSVNNLYPGALIADCGSLTIIGTGLHVESFSTVQVSAHDLWWCAAIADDAVTVLGTEAGGQTSAFGSTFALQQQQGMLTKTYSLGGAWPSTFPTSAAAGNGDVPSIALHYNG